MGKKKHRLTQSQINGISWIAIALAISLALYFFSRTIDSQPANADIQESENQIRLENFEDSIYHSRRPNRTFLRNTIQNQHHKSIKTDSLYTSEPPAPVRKPLMVELNSADSTTLQLLHGIGPAFARRIVRYREKLGGFSNKEQLLEVYGSSNIRIRHTTLHATSSTSVRTASHSPVPTTSVPSRPAPTPCSPGSSPTSTSACRVRRGTTNEKGNHLGCLL